MANAITDEAFDAWMKRRRSQPTSHRSELSKYAAVDAIAKPIGKKQLASELSLAFGTLAGPFKKETSMRSLLLAAIVLTVAYSRTAATDVVTFGHATFDFDAPSPSQTEVQEAFFQR